MIHKNVDLSSWDTCTVNHKKKKYILLAKCYIKSALLWKGGVKFAKYFK
jgi:hypothetical protein